LRDLSEIDIPLEPSEIDVPLKPAAEAEALSAEEVDKRELAKLRAKLDSDKKNLKAAHVLVIVLIVSVAASYLFAVFGSPFLKREVKIPNEILSVLQAALFTLLGFLFGDKNANGKN